MPNDNKFTPADFDPVLKSMTAFRICAFGVRKFSPLFMTRV